MSVIKLSTHMLSTLQCPKGKRRIEYCDSEVPGLYVEVRDSQNKTFYWRTKDAYGKTIHFRISAVCDLSLADARTQVQRLKLEHSEALRNPQAKQEAKKQDMTLSDFWKDYYLPLAKQTKASWKRDVQLFVRLEKKFGAKKLADIERHEIQLFHGNLLKEPLSPSSADLHAALLKRMLSLCVEYSLLEKNPASKMKLFHADNRVENLMDDAQLGNLLEVLRTDPCRSVCQICLFLLSTGARLNEALSATWSQIDKENHVWRIPAKNTKSKRTRSVPLNDTAMEVVEGLDTEGKYEHLFVNSRTEKPFVNFTRVWYKLRKKAGLPHRRLHDLRHGAANNLINSGASLYIVQAILGHSNPSVTQRYAHLSMQSLHDASANASAIISRARQSMAAAVAGTGAT